MRLELSSLEKDLASPDEALVLLARLQERNAE